MKIFKKGQKNRRGALALALTGLTLALLLTLTTHAAPYNGYPTEDSSLLSQLKAVLHPGAGEQYVNGRITLDPGVGALSGITTYFDARGVDGNGNKRPSFFQASKNAAHSVLASLYDFMVVDGSLFIGLPLGAFQSSVGGDEFGLNISANPNDPTYLFGHTFTTGGVTGTSFSATLQKVNIAGAVRSSALAHQYSEPQRVCVDANGIFTLDCPSGTTQTYSCTGTTPTNASLCSGDDQGLSQDTQITLVSSCTNTQKCEYTCNTGYHIENGSCVQDASYEWQTGDWGACTGGSAARCEGTWTTQGSGACVGDGKAIYEENDASASGQSYDEEVCADQSNSQECSDFNSYITGSCDTPQGYESASCTGTCSWNSNVETHSCSASNPQSESACESQNSACTWVEAQRKVRTRPVYCVESGTNNVVDDSNCSSPKPDDTKLCALSVLETVYCDDSHHEYGATKKVLVSGQPSQSVNYTTSIHIGHGGGESRVYDENGDDLSPQGTLQLDSNGRKIIYVKACGGPSLNCNASQGDASASFTDTDTNETVSASGAGQAAAGCST